MGEFLNEENTNIKHEPSTEFLLLIPREKDANEEEFPIPIKTEIIDEIVDLNFECENENILEPKIDTESNIELGEQRVKHEPSVEYLLIVPSEKIVEEFPKPIPTKKEPHLDLNGENDDEGEAPQKWKQTVMDVKKFVCYKCSISKVFKTRDELTNHHRDEHLYCAKCKATFQMLNVFMVHKCFVADNKNKVFKCQYCSKHFINRGNLAQHISIHLDSMKEACKICGIILVKVRLIQHMKQSHGKTKFKCDLCSFKTTTKFQLEPHMKSHSKPYKCKVCSKTFSETRYFLEHQINHDNPNPFKCKECPASYTRLSSLNRHMHTEHSQARKFACSQCKYKGKTKDDLTTHNKSHTRAYKCDVCGWKFSRSSMLKEHRVLHDNPHAYQCDVCKLSFTQKKVLRDHKLTKKKLCKNRVENKLFHYQNKGISAFINAKKNENKIGELFNTNKFQCDLCPSVFGAKVSVAHHMNEHEKSINMQNDKQEKVSSEDQVTTVEKTVEKKLQQESQKPVKRRNMKIAKRPTRYEAAKASRKITDYMKIL